MTESRDKKKDKKSSRPISEHFGSVQLTPMSHPDQTMTHPRQPRVRQKSVDNSAPTRYDVIIDDSSLDNFRFSNRSTKEDRKTTGSRSYHRSTPDLLQAPINPIYQPRERDSSFVTKI